MGNAFEACRQLRKRIAPWFCMARSKRFAGWACMLGLTFCTATCESARTLEFKCIEPSRYKNLLQAFNDNPSTLTSYFGLEPTQLPDMNTADR